VRTATGEVINLGIQNEREWLMFCRKVLRQPSLAADPRFAGNGARLAHRAALSEIIAAAFAGRTFDEARRDLDEAGIAYGEQRTMASFAEHPQLRARDRWRAVSTPAGSVDMLLPPVTASWQAPMGAVPALGEHTADVLAWLAEGD
jgi:crotonobetainyl-CoA:carnitine CoA-transferase CaiB-like acyl-CoA transferase